MRPCLPLPPARQIAERIGKTLERQGLLSCDCEASYLTLCGRGKG
jgi:hypothetical protein